jgi:valyl-tRNA synthetase
VKLKIIAKKDYKTEKIYQDEDVLDTWFSSALWPFTTLGWPNEENDLSKFYPTNLLVTGFDIIFFWVARMMMMGLYFQKNIPFSEIYIHALVRDENGQKMSKSKGNVVDPLKLIDNFGADSLRFTLASMASYGRDIKLSEARVEGYRNFGTKLWNAARFCELNNCIKLNNKNISELSNPITTWLLSEMIKTEKNIDTFLDDYKFNEAANEIYHFVWHIFCDWYLELIKPYFNDNKHDELEELRYITSISLNFILIKLHPFMPFITEDLWKKVSIKEESLISSSWNISLPSLKNVSFVKSTETIIEIITSIRSIRSELNIPSKKELLLQVYEKDSGKIDEIKNINLLLNKLIKINKIERVNHFSDRSASFSASNIDFALVIDESIDLSSEIKRIEKEEIKIINDIELLKKKLSNDSFVKKAPKNIVKESNDRLDDLLSDQVKLGESKLFINKLISHGK